MSSLLETDVVQHLLLPGSETVDVLRRSQRATVTSREQAAIDLARRWVRTIVRQPLWPSDTTIFHALPRERGRFDTIRSSSEISDLRIETAQTMSAFSIKLHGSRDVGRTPIDDVRRLAAIVLDAPRPLAFEEMGRWKDVVRGRNVDPQRGHDWLQCLEWWVDEHDIGFVTLKLIPGRGRVVITASPESSVQWFASP